MKSEITFSKALVTGATSGIGEALAHLLASKGINLLLTGRDEKRLHSLAEELQKKVHVTYVTADLAVETDRKKLIDTMRQFAPDLVINNAGFGLYGDALSHVIKEQLKILTVNGNAVLEITLAAAQNMLQNHKTGVVLNVSSAASFYVFPGLAVYAAAKSFVTQVSQALDVEMNPHGIRILAACPGMVLTHFAQRAAKNAQYKNSTLSMSSQYAAEQLWKQIVQRKTCYLFDWKTRWGTRLSRFVPTRWLAKILQNAIQR